VAARIHVDAGLAREEQHNQRGEKHHVAGQAEKHKKTDTVQPLPGPAMLALPVVVTASASAAGGSSVNGRFAANSWLFPFYLGWGARKSDGHRRASVCL
jgi:hypothetical protein